MVPALGSKSKICAGELKIPPSTSPMCPCVFRALMGTRLPLEFSVPSVIEVGLSTLKMTAPGGIVLFLPSACTTLQVDCSPAVVGSLTDPDPALVLPWRETGFGPGSAVKYTCPFGKMAAAASSAPNCAFGIVPPGPVRSAIISGPAAQLFAEGV